MPKALYAMVSCSAAVYGIGRYRERQSVTIAGLLVGGINVVIALALIGLIYNNLFSLSTRSLGDWLCPGRWIVDAAVFTAGGLPINESLFGYLTDVKLLELSNADLPVLGNWLCVHPEPISTLTLLASLAEDACRAVGANSLLARIGALYHDIGKLAAPEYFVENQQGLILTIDLRPQQSAKIITSHVTYGAQVGKRNWLTGPDNADFIPQHHGTRTLHYFLRKAQAQAKPNEIVDEAGLPLPWIQSLNSKKLQS